MNKQESERKPINTFDTIEEITQFENLMDALEKREQERIAEIRADAEKADIALEEARKLYLHEITMQQQAFEAMVTEKRAEFSRMLAQKNQEFEAAAADQIQKFARQKARGIKRIENHTENLSLIEKQKKQLDTFRKVFSAKETGIYPHMDKQYHYLGNKPLYIDNIGYMECHIPNKGFICNIQGEKHLLVPIYANVYRGYEIYNTQKDFTGSLCQDVKWRGYSGSLVKSYEDEEEYDGYALLMQKVSDSSIYPILFNTWTSCYNVEFIEERTLDIAFDLNQMDITEIDDYEAFIHAEEAPYYMQIGHMNLISQYSIYEYESLKYALNICGGVSNLSADIRIMGYCGEPSHIHIPSAIYGLPVKKIDQAFMCCDTLKSVSIEGSGLLIGENSFLDCRNLESVVIYGRDIVVDNGAFKNCQSLKTLTLLENDAFAKDFRYPDDVSFRLYADSFCNCENLTSLILLGYDIELRDGSFSNCKKLSEVVMYDDSDIHISAFSSDHPVNCILISENDPDPMENIDPKVFAKTPDLSIFRSEDETSVHK